MCSLCTHRIRSNRKPDKQKEMGGASSKDGGRKDCDGTEMDVETCSNCGKASPGEAPLQRCSACQSVHYCSKDCQVCGHLAQAYEPCCTHCVATPCEPCGIRGPKMIVQTPSTDEWDGTQNAIDVLLSHGNRRRSTGRNSTRRSARILPRRYPSGSLTQIRFSTW